MTLQPGSGGDLELPLPDACDPESLYRHIAALSADCIKVLDSDTRLLWMNQAGCELMSIADPSRVVGSCWVSFWDGEAQARAAAAVAEALRGGTGKFIGPCRTLDGELKWWSVVVTRVPGRAGPLLLVISRDLSELAAMAAEMAATAEAERLARARAEEASERREALLFNVSHDLKAPLNAVLGWSALLADAGADSYRSQAAAAITAAAKQQLRMVDDLLQAARGDEALLNRQPVRLWDVVGEAAALAAPALAAKGLRLTREGESCRAIVSGDADALLRVVSNLLDNALKFTPPEGSIKVALSTDERSATLLVADSGCGIRSEALEQVFERFWQEAPAGSARRPTGVGLGLSVVKSIVESHGGLVHAHSAGAGRGSTFTVQLPLNGVPPRRGVPARARVDATSHLTLAGTRVVVVHPNLVHGELLAAMLRTFDAVPLVVTGRDGAVLTLQSQRVGVAVLDGDLPSLEVASILHTCSSVACGPVPALLLARGERAGSPAAVGCEVMAKPVFPRAFASRVHALASGRATDAGSASRHSPAAHEEVA